MNTLELLDKKEGLQKRAREIMAKAQGEKRQLNEGEGTEFNNILKEISDIDTQIRSIEEKNEKDQKKKNHMPKEKEADFSLLGAIRSIANNQPLDERAQEVINQGIAEMRHSGQSYQGQIILPTEMRAEIKATAGTNGQEVVGEDIQTILAPLRNRLVLTQAGATYMSGLVGDVSIPAYAGTNATWAAETAAASDGAGAFSEVKLSPKRLTTYVDISKQFLLQDSASAEAMLRSDIVAAISDKLENTIFGAAAGSSTQPKGFFNGITAEKAAVTYKDIVSMEETLETAKVYGDLKWIMSPKAKADLRTTEKSASTARYLMEDNNTMDGYPALTSGNVHQKGLILGNWSEYVIGQWGGIDLTVDPYTQATNGKVRLVVNAYFDAKPRRDAAFKVVDLHSASPA